MKGRKSAGNFRDEQGIGNNSAGGKLLPLRVLGEAAWDVVGADAHIGPSTYGSTPIDGGASPTKGTSSRYALTAS